MQNINSISRKTSVYWFSLCLLIITLIANSAQASENTRYQNRALCIDSPWAYEPLGEVYAYIVAQEGHTDELVGATSTAAKRVEVHKFLIKSGFAVMEAANDLQFNHTDPLILGPAGLHLMLLDTDGPLAAGNVIPVTLNFAKSESVDVDVRVIAMDEMPPEPDTTCKPDTVY